MTTHETAERHQSLWTLTISPAIWAAHFLASYIVGALWCGTWQPGASLTTLRIIIAATAFIALAGIGFTGWFGWRKHQYGEGDPPYDKDTPEDRHRFLGFATLLLSGLSAIAVIFVALTSVFIQRCW